MSELPKVFANKVDKDIGNNSTYSYGEKKENKSITNSNLTVEQKIRGIFNSPNYVYKAEVIIEMNGSKLSKSLIGYNKEYLITFDDEKIPIQKIEDIYLKTT